MELSLWLKCFIFIFNRKKGQSKKLQETYIKLKIEGKEIISGVYSKAAENDVRWFISFLFQKFFKSYRHIFDFLEFPKKVLSVIRQKLLEVLYRALSVK